MSIDPKMVQKVFMISSDMIARKAYLDGALGLDDEGNYTKRLDEKQIHVFYPTIDSDSIDGSKIIEVLNLQSQIASGHPVPDSIFARTVFSSDHSEQFSDAQDTGAKKGHALITRGRTENNYVTTYRIYFKINGDLYYFDINEFNQIQTLNSGIQMNDEAIFHSIEIENNAKDNYTVKASYTITLKIIFSKYESLINKKIKLTSCVKGKPDIKICLINLLYKFYDPVINILPLEIAQAQDHDGIFISQVTKFIEPRVSSVIKKYYDTDELHKNYHCMYYKHSIDIYRSEEKTPIPNSNILTISYTAYESDGAEKPLSTAGTPRYSYSLYNILTANNIVKNEETKRYIGIQSDDASNGINAINSLADAITNIVREAKAAATNLNPEQRRRINSLISAKKKELGKYRSKVKTLVLATLIDNFDVKRIKVPNSVFGVWDENNFWENWKKSFTVSNMLSATLTGAVFGGWGAAIGAVGYTAYTAIEAYMHLEHHSVDVQAAEIRAYMADALENQKIETLGEPIFADYVQRLTNKPSIEEIRRKLDEKKLRYSPHGGGSFDVGTEIFFARVFSLGSKSYDEVVVELAAQSHVIELPPNMTAKQYLENSQTMNDSRVTLEGIKREQELKVPVGQAAADTFMHEIKFIFFKDIIKILTLLDPTEKTQVLCFNHFFKTSEAGTYANINYAHIPISFALFLEWFYKDFIDNEKTDSFYDSEMFFRNAYEGLIKQAITLGQTADPTTRETIPIDLRLHSTIHNYDKLVCLKNWAKTSSAAVRIVEYDYREVALDLVASQNLTATGENNLCKVITLASVQDIKYFDFYGDYQAYALKKLKPLLLSNVSFKKEVDGKLTDEKEPYIHRIEHDYTYGFERYINERHLMPCVILVDTLMNESFLLQKNIKFSKLDNPNLVTGNILNGGSVLRSQYNFSASFKSYLHQFIDISSMIFVAPPTNRKYSAVVNMLGFGGLYFIKSSKLIHNFQVRAADKIVLTSFDSKYDIEASLISFGEDARKIGSPHKSKLDAASKAYKPGQNLPNISAELGTDITVPQK